MNSVPSPPYLSPSFETIEARLWATDTIDNVFSEPTTVELPSPNYQKLEPLTTPVFDTNNYFLTRSGTLMDMEALYVNTTLIPYKSNQNSRIYVSSLLSSSLSTSSLSSSLSSDINQQGDTSTASSNRHSFAHSSPNPIQQRQRLRSSTTVLLSLEPTTSTKTLSRRFTLTRRLKRHWTVDESTTSGVRRLFTSQQQQKERKAQTIWREKLHGYLIDTAFQAPAPRLDIDSPRLAYCIASEMLTTEETYLGHLSVFKQMIIDPFLKAFQNRYMVRDLHTIFSLVPQLITLSTSLIHRWCISIEQHTYIMNDRTTTDDIGKSFCDLEAEFKVYAYYAVHYNKAQKCVTRIQQKSVYQQWMHAVAYTKETKRMGLGDYLIAPIQRITRYCLLIKNLIKYTGGQDARLDRALKYLTALAAAMNDCQY